MTQTNGMPTYVVLDVSRSMQAHEPLLNETLGNILNALYQKPRISEFIQLSIITFSTKPEVVLKMTELRSLDYVPKIVCGGATNFAPLFDLLRARIETDLPNLRAGGFAVLRPVVFLLTDGAPTDRPDDEWEEAHARLIDKDWKYHPHIITYGFGEAVESIVVRMATKVSYMAAADEDNSDALTTILSTMLNSLVSSAAAGELELPENVASFRTIDPNDQFE
jgi:uncharacterized protein YegL